MKKILKVLAWLLAALVITAVAAVIVIPLVFDPNDYRDEISAAVKKHTGRELSIEGRIELSLFPWLGARLGAMQLSNAKGFGPEPFARIGKAEVRVQLLPLLRREVKMDTIVLHGVEANLGRRANGRSNWDDLVGKAAAPVAPDAAAPAPVAPEDDPLAALGALALGGLELRDAKVVWDDRMAGARYSVEHLNLTVGAIRLAQPFAVALEFDVDSSQPPMRGHIGLASQVALDLAGQKYRLDGTILSADLNSQLIPGGRLAARLQADIRADLAAQTAKLSGLRLEAAGVTLQGQVEAAAILAQPSAQGRLQLEVTDPATLLAPFQAQLPPALKAAALRGSRLDTTFELALEQQTATLALQLDALGMRAQGKVDATSILGQPGAQGRLQVAVKDSAVLLAPFQAQLPPQLKPAALQDSRLDADFTLSLAQETAHVTLQLDALGAWMQGKVDATSILAQPDAAGSVQLVLHDAAALLRAAPGLLPPTLQAADLRDSRLETAFALSLGRQTLDVSNLRLNALGLALTAQARGSRLIDAPEFNGRIALGEFVPRDLLASLGIALPEMADPSTLTKAALGFDFAAGLDHAALSRLQLRFDDSTLTGSAAVRNFQQPALRYDLSLDAIDADRYLPPPPPEPVPATPASAAAAGATQLPPETIAQLRALDVAGTARIGKLKVMNLRSAAIHATVTAKDGLLRVHPVGARLYGGSYDGNLSFDVRGKVPLIGMDERLAGVQAGPLLKDFMGKDYVSGTATVSAKLSARGIDPLQVRKSLNGTAAFSFSNGAVNGLNIAQLIRNAYASLQKQPPPPDEVRSTDFAAISGTATLKDGLVSNTDLKAHSPLFRVEGRGTAHLATEALDYLVRAAVVGTLEGQGGKALSDLKGLTVPLRISGSFTEPKFNVELGALLDEKTKQALAAEKKKAQEALAAEKRKAQQALAEEKQKARQEAERRLEEEKKKAREDVQQKLKDALKLR